MGINNEKINARTKEKECNAYSDPGWGDSIGRESENNGMQQERNGGKNRSRSNFYRFGQTITGGMLRQLIEEYKDQLATKEDSINRLLSEVQRLKTRIEEFESLEEQLSTAEIDS